MRALEATVWRVLVSSLALLEVACKKSPRGSAPSAPPAALADAGTVVTVYVPPKAVDQLMVRLTAVASRHRWALSVRTDSGALAEADLVVVDSAGTLVARLRPGSPAAAQAKAMAEAVLP